tara:strand:- start:392 stop:598 length:207 start_codon:yes stop_codon:yes gene_type:complete
MNEIQAIEAITKDILAGLYGTRQRAGTETQKWQYAYNQARKIYQGDLIIDPELTWFDDGNEIIKFEEI